MKIRSDRESNLRSIWTLWIIFAPIILMFLRYGIFPQSGDGLLGGIEIILLPFYWILQAVLYSFGMLVSKAQKRPNPYEFSMILTGIITFLLIIAYLF